MEKKKKNSNMEFKIIVSLQKIKVWTNFIMWTLFILKLIHIWKLDTIFNLQLPVTCFWNKLNKITQLFIFLFLTVNETLINFNAPKLCDKIKNSTCIIFHYKHAAIVLCNLFQFITEQNIRKTVEMCTDGKILY